MTELGNDVMMNQGVQPWRGWEGGGGMRWREQSGQNKEVGRMGQGGELARKGGRFGGSGIWPNPSPFLDLIHLHGSIQTCASYRAQLLPWGKWTNIPQPQHAETPLLDAEEAVLVPLRCCTRNYIGLGCFSPNPPPHFAFNSGEFPALEYSKACWLFCGILIGPNKKGLGFLLLIYFRKTIPT